MKIRKGFVSNSSSTSHIIAWNGEKEDLEQILNDYKNIFPANYDDYEISSSKIIDAIISKKDNIITSQEFIDMSNNRINILDYRVPIEKDKFLINYYKRELDELKSDIQKVQKTNWVLIVSFGDHEGDFEGGDLGNIMDYEGRYINVNSKNLVYFTEQNR